jgi:putative ABC transport system substrate-binding protein
MDQQHEQYDRLPALAADLVRRQPSVIVANHVSAAAAKAATATIPIVFTTAVDPVQLGLVTSLARPSGNLTGVTTLNMELVPKRLELLHELSPTATSLALLVNPTNSDAETVASDTRAAARALGLELDVVEASTDRDLETAFASLAQRQVGGLVIAPDPFFVSRIIPLAALALHRALPAAFEFRQFAAAGGLMSYGGSLADSYRLAGIYAGRILKGERPADLPVQQSTKVELFLNLKTAKALGITVPLPLSGRAMRSSNEAARVHHAPRRRGGMAACGTGAAGIGAEGRLALVRLSRRFSCTALLYAWTCRSRLLRGAQPLRRERYTYSASIAVIGFTVSFSCSVQAQSFDCRTNTHSDERAICSNAELGELDSRMSRSFNRLFNSLTDAGRSELRSQQREWLHERRGCGSNIPCIRDKYRQRISELESVQGYPSPPARNELLSRNSPAQTEATSSGTGFFVSFPGYVLTNQHVIDGCHTATISRPGYPISDARIVGFDATNDLALLTTTMGTKMVPPLRMGVRVGENVFVYGFPLAGLLSSSGNFTVGNITSVAGLGDDSRILQISAPVQPGNSGGPLLDRFGNVVGIIVSKLNALRLAQVTQDVAQNINFAIKANIAANFLEVNNIQTQVGSIAQAVEGTEIADRAKQFTVQVTCKPIR